MRSQGPTMTDRNVRTLGALAAVALTMFILWGCLALLGLAAQAGAIR